MIADPADREVWVCEIGAGMFIAGMRLTGPSTGNTMAGWCSGAGRYARPWRLR